MRKWIFILAVLKSIHSLRDDNKIECVSGIKYADGQFTVAKKNLDAPRETIDLLKLDGSVSVPSEIKTSGINIGCSGDSILSSLRYNKY
jgi:hypothetical protein